MIIGFTGGKSTGRKEASKVFDSLESTGMVYKFSFHSNIHRMENNFKMVSKDDVVLVCDVNSNDEAYCIKNKGGIIIEIVRPGFNKSTILPSIVDFKIENKGTIDDMHSSILDLFI
jgi:hypothetical protein